MDETVEMAVEWVAIGDVFPNPSNPRLNDAAVGPVADSLRRFGWQQPIVVKPDGEVVAGNTRLKAAKQLGMERVPVVRFQGSDLDAVAFGIADNRTGEIAGWDEPALRELIAHLAAEDALDGVGYTEEEIEALLAAGHEDPTEGLEDDGPGDPPEDPVSRAGDLWILGEHRLLCGDSTKAEDVRRLLGEELFTVKSFVQAHPLDSEKTIFYQASEGPEPYVVVRGNADLIGGAATVVLPESLRFVADPDDIHVQLTPHGNTPGLYVEEVDLYKLQVREVMGGASSLRFSWEVTSSRPYVPHDDIRDSRTVYDLDSMDPVSRSMKENWLSDQHLLLRAQYEALMRGDRHLLPVELGYVQDGPHRLEQGTKGEGR